jgi:hypothetical protein
MSLQAHEKLSKNNRAFRPGALYRRSTGRSGIHPRLPQAVPESEWALAPASAQSFPSRTEPSTQLVRHRAQGKLPTSRLSGSNPGRSCNEQKALLIFRFLFYPTLSRSPALPPRHNRVGSTQVVTDA